MKVALVYDRVNKWGGAERLLLVLHELFPNAPLYTSVYNPKTAPWASVFNVKTSFLNNFPFAALSHEYYALLMPLAFESFSFDDYDLVISISSEAAKGIVTKPKTFHLCYCLTPTRYLWSGYNEYFANSSVRVLSKPAVSYLKNWDLIAAQRADAYIAISKEVKDRIKKYYGREAEVVYPPVTILNPKSEIPFGPSFHSDESSERAGRGQNSKQSQNTKYYLVVSRLVPYKRIDIAIEACNKLKLPLVVIGTGSEEKKLKRIGGSTIIFVGSLTDAELVEYYKGCRALIFPGKEDFGLTVLEAQSFGKPVIAFKGGGTLETVIEGKTGEFFSRQTVDSLVALLKNFNGQKYSIKDCLKNAQKYSKQKFKREFMKIVQHLVYAL